MIARLPNSAGTYVLVLDLPEEQRLLIGRLGSFSFPEGTYLYFGSASGPGGLQARIRHHMGVSNRPFWHLDHLRPYTCVRACFFSVSTQPLECIWQRKASQVYKPIYPARKFGASDCRSGCFAHLMRLGSEVNIADLGGMLNEVEVDGIFFP